MSDEVSDPDDTEARRVCQAIMEDICNELFGLGSSAAAPQASAEGATSSGQQQNEDFFKTLSFYDDDDPLDLPFESLFDSNNVPTEFSQQPSQAPPPSIDLDESAKHEIVRDILTDVLHQVQEQGVLPRKIATVHPFSLNQPNDPPAAQPTGLRLAGFAVDPSPASLPPDPHQTPRPTLKLANFAVDPSSSSSSQNPEPRLKLANFAVDPGSDHGSAHHHGSPAPGHNWPGPPPLQQRPGGGPAPGPHHPRHPGSAPPHHNMAGEMSRQMFSPPSLPRSPGLPSLTRAPSPHVVSGTGPCGSPTIGRTPPPGSPGGASAQNVACFGHFERELEYRYCFRSLDFQVSVVTKRLVVENE